MRMIGVELASLSQAEGNLFSHTTFSQNLLAGLHPAANNFAPTYVTNELLTMLVMVLTCTGRYSGFRPSRGQSYASTWLKFFSTFRLLVTQQWRPPWDFPRCLW